MGRNSIVPITNMERKYVRFPPPPPSGADMMQVQSNKPHRNFSVTTIPDDAMFSGRTYPLTSIGIE